MFVDNNYMCYTSNHYFLNIIYRRILFYVVYSLINYYYTNNLFDNLGHDKFIFLHFWIRLIIELVIIFFSGSRKFKLKIKT